MYALLPGADANGKFRHIRSQRFEALMNLSRTLQTVARHMGQAPAITFEGRQLTYAAFEHQAATIAGALANRHGLKAGDRVALIMENSLEFLPALYGIWRAGLCAVPINAKLHAKEMAWIVEDSGAKLVMTSADAAGNLALLTDHAWPPTIVARTRDWMSMLFADPIVHAPADPDEEAWIFYTSGTTGRPKGAILTHRNLLFAAHAYYADIDFIDGRDCMLHAAPLTHGAGLYALAHIARGSHQIVFPSFDSAQVFEAFATRKNVSMFAAPTMVVRLLNDARAGSTDVSGLKTIAYGGAPMYVADLKRAIAMFGSKLFQVYGQGESPMTITGLTKALHADTAHPDFEMRLASAGIARTGVAFKIVDDAGKDVPFGEIGEIITKSDCVMKGYWNNAEANSKALRDGWLWTGDLGAVDATGFLTIKDRSKDLIISGGANIYPREIEEVLLTHRSVLECSVTSRPHAEWGEEVIAFVVKRPAMDVTEAELDKLCLDNIARFKRPKGYRFVDALPKNNYGKVLKTELRDWLRAETPDA
jgi:long-chain acyl-CoA synthetase